jgi:hypothetical protein
MPKRGAPPVRAIENRILPLVRYRDLWVVCSLAAVGLAAWLALSAVLQTPDWITFAQFGG